MLNTDSFEFTPDGSAYFEAGQAVVACLEGMAITAMRFHPETDDVWIHVLEPDLPSGRLVDPGDRVVAESLIRALLAGSAAEVRYGFGECSEQSFGDEEFWEQASIWRAVELAGRVESRGPVLRPLWAEVCMMIGRDDVWTAVERVASSLTASGELLGCEVDEIVQFSAISSTP